MCLLWYDLLYTPWFDRDTVAKAVRRDRYSEDAQTTRHHLLLDAVQATKVHVQLRPHSLVNHHEHVLFLLMRNQHVVIEQF